MEFGFGIAADDQNALPHFREGGERILRRRGFADAALTIECDLPELGHGMNLFSK